VFSVFPQAFFRRREPHKGLIGTRGAKIANVPLARYEEFVPPHYGNISVAFYIAIFRAGSQRRFSPYFLMGRIRTKNFNVFKKIY
jgi:hypothetical protein